MDTPLSIRRGVVVLDDDEDHSNDTSGSESDDDDSSMMLPAVLFRTPGSAPPSVTRPRKMSELSDEGREVWAHARALEERLKQLREGATASAGLNFK